MTESVSLKMSLQAADQLCRTKRVGSKVSLELEGRLIPAQIKEKKKNHLGTEIEHISFQALAADQWVNSVAHIFLKNTDLVPGVLEQMIFEVPFSSLPADRKFSEYTQAQRFDLFSKYAVIRSTRPSEAAIDKSDLRPRRIVRTRLKI